jgi:hypothetical protein
MKQFNETGCTVSGLPDSIGYAGSKEDEQRPHLFSFSLNNVSGDLVKQRYAAFHGSPEFFFKVHKVICNGCLYFPECKHEIF